MESYNILKEVIVRIPKNSFSVFEKYRDCNLFELYSDTEFKEALRLASLDLLGESSILYSRSEKKLARIKSSLFRYITRMSTRCTPFGLFAGCALCEFSDFTNLVVSNEIERFTRLDMSYLCSLSQYLSRQEEVKYKLKYYPNSSIYKVGNEYRYIYYTYSSDKRINEICSIKKTSYLKFVLEKSKNGIFVNDLANCLKNEYISYEDSIQYIDDLINSKILISELDPVVTGCDYFSRIVSIIENIDSKGRYLSLLKDIESSIRELDRLKNDDKLYKYDYIESLISQIGADYNKKYLFQVDMKNILLKNKIGENIRNEISSVVNFLAKFNSLDICSDLERFKNEFAERFDENEVQLALALDPDIGIGYPVSDQIDNSSDFLKGFDFIDDNENLDSCTFNKTQMLILKKILSSDDLVSKEILLDDKDIIDFSYNRDDLPDSFSVFFEIIDDSENSLILRLKSIGNNSAANLISRFSHIDEKIENIVKSIAVQENDLHPDTILAEIVYLPNARIGNVLSRPHIRNYEFELLALSSLSRKQIIYYSDIMISLKNGKFVLKSKKYNKEIMMYSTNSYNNKLSNIPLYRFLSDLQYQNAKTSLMPNFDNLFSLISHIPRIRYQNTVLSPATWKIKVKDIKSFLNIDSDEQLLYYSSIFRKQNLIPKFSLLCDYDNELLIDWDSPLSLRAFLSVVKNRDFFFIQEFLHNTNSLLVKDVDGNGYLNECIVSVVKSKIHEN